MTVRKTENGKWAYDFWFNNRRYIRVIGDSKEQAEGAMAVHRKRLLDEKHGLLSPIRDVGFDDLAEEYYKKVSAGKRSWRRDRLSLDHLKRYFRGKMVSEISSKSVDDYKERRLRDVSGPTINREIGLLSNVFATAIRWHHANSNPVKGVARYEESEPVERILEPDEEERLMAASSPRLRRILTILTNTGLRRNELLSLRWKNVSLQAGQIIVQKTNAKSKKMRIVPLNGAAIEALRAIPKVHDLVFYNPATKTSFKDIKTAFHAACEDAGIEGLRLHDLRHTFASRLRRKGVDLGTIMKLLGHSTIAMTLRYAHYSKEDEREAVLKLDEKQENPERKPESHSPATEPQPSAKYSYAYN